MDNGGWTFSGDYVTPDPPPDPDIKSRWCGIKGLDPRF